MKSAVDEAAEVLVTRACGCTQVYYPKGDRNDRVRRYRLRTRRCIDCLRRDQREGHADSKSTRLVIVARKLTQPFTTEDLTLMAWRMFPEAFGFSQGQYPCTHTVGAVLLGSGGPVRSGYMKRVATSRYQLTPAGYALREGD